MVEEIGTALLEVALLEEVIYFFLTEQIRALTVRHNIERRPIPIILSFQQES